MTEPASILAGVVKLGGLVLGGSTALVLGLIDGAPEGVVTAAVNSSTQSLWASVGLLVATMLTGYINKQNKKITTAAANPLQAELIQLANDFREADGKRESHSNRIFERLGGIDENIKTLKEGHRDITARLSKIERTQTGEIRRP